MSKSLALKIGYEGNYNLAYFNDYYNESGDSDSVFTDKLLFGLVRDYFNESLSDLFYYCNFYPDFPLSFPKFGYYLNNTKNSLYPSNNSGLASWFSTSIPHFLYYNGSKETEYLESLSYEEQVDILESKGYKVGEPMTLTFKRLSELELEELENEVNPEEPFEDAFFLMYDKLTDRVDTDEEMGYTPMTYDETSDEIKFTTEVSFPMTPFDCTPTSLNFVPTVTIPEGKSRAIMRFTLKDSDGKHLINHNGQTEYTEIEFTLNQYNQDENIAYKIADDIFLVSGLDMMRQLNVGNYVKYTPYNLNNDSTPIAIQGYDSNGDGVDEWKTFYRGIYTLSFVLIDDLPEDAIDYTLEQFGEQVDIYSCGYATNGGL